MTLRFSTFTFAWIATGLISSAPVIADEPPRAEVFYVKPYLQLGDDPSKLGPGDLRLLWQTEDVDAPWSVEFRPALGQDWKATDAPKSKRIALQGAMAHRVLSVDLKGLTPGGTFAYRVSKDGKVVFETEGKARKSADQPYRFVAVGDIAQGTVAQKAIAYQMVQAKPDFAMITGDIVYARGRISEYREKYWPVYNADDPSPSSGGPLLRSTLTISAPGNHDIATRDFARYPDGLAYYYYWDQPLNGPEKGPFNIPLVGPEANQKAFLDASGPAYPRMANFSFDYANAHWTVLDANGYVDWRDPELRAWVERDLTSAQGATWRFVSFHQPGFNSAKEHFEQQQMRLMADIFEAGKVDVVFNGHVHNYQRTFPIRYVVDKSSDGKMIRNKDLVPGKWTLDKTFDGDRDTTPEGVIYLVTGGGGAGLYNPEQQEKPETWQPFTDKFVSQVHSITVVDVDGKTLSIRQVSDEGKVVDRLKVTK